MTTVATVSCGGYRYYINDDMNVKFRRTSALHSKLPFLTIMLNFIMLINAYEIILNILNIRMKMISNKRNHDQIKPFCWKTQEKG